MNRFSSVLLLMVVYRIGFGQCLQPSATDVININNVTAPIDNDGSMGFSQIPVSGYTIQTETGEISAGMTHSLWVAGVGGGEKRIAAMRHGTVGNDYFPGPLNVTNASVDPSTCAEYNRIWSIERWRVQEYIARFGQSGYTIPQEILNWPAHGDLNLSQDYNLAPYFDADNSGYYDPEEGDYPYFELEPTAFNGGAPKLKGDKAFFWVMNDKGGPHTETGGEAIGIEVRCFAYAFNTCGPLGDATFYTYQIINRGDFTLNNAYIGLWVDIDLESANDDYVMCDVGRGMGFNYNANPNNRYAAVGFDILAGPYLDPDNEDNDGDGMVDNERFGMYRFLVQSNTGGGFHPSQSDPQNALDYYDNLQGKWNDGSWLCYGGTGHAAGGCDQGTLARYMFPGSSDPTGLGTGGMPQLPWSEESAGNTAYDRRFLISSGPFTLLPGSVQDVHYAAIVGYDPSGQQVFSEIESVSDFVQAAFDSGFADLPCCPPNATINLDQPMENQFLFSSVTEGDTYHWDFGDGTTSSERFPPTHSYSDNQTHQVTLIVSNDCGSDTSYIDASTVLFNVVERKLEFSVYPNPATSHIRLESNMPLHQVWLTDIAGKRLMPLQQNNDLWQADLSSLPAGIYLIKAEAEDDSYTVKKVVKH